MRLSWSDVQLGMVVRALPIDDDYEDFRRNFGRDIPIGRTGVSDWNVARLVIPWIDQDPRAIWSVNSDAEYEELI